MYGPIIYHKGYSAETLENFVGRSDHPPIFDSSTADGLLTFFAYLTARGDGHLAITSSPTLAS